MSELQTEDTGDDVNLDDVAQNDTGTEESGADLATATGEDQDNKQDGDKSQELAEKAINKQHRKFRDEERLRIAAEGVNKELRDRLEALEADKGDIVIPPIPDPYDENYEVLIQQRDEAIVRKANQNAQETVKTDQLTASNEAAQKAEQTRMDTLIGGYDKQIATLGLNAGDVKKAGEVVVSYGISNEVAEYILADIDGPLITSYLAENPIMLDELRSLSPIQAAFKINSDIRTAASTLKPQASLTPDPAEVLNGTGTVETVSPLLKGATFE